MQLFYTPDLTPDSQHFRFEPNEGRHIVKVLRAKAGDTLETTNGKGCFFTIQILEADPKKCTAKVLSYRKELDNSYHLHLAVAPTKNSGRYEWFLEKATEIGVHEISPVICARSERKALKLDRMGRILETAMKQSLRPYLPKLNAALPFEEFIKQPLSGMKCVAHCAPGEKTELKRMMGANHDIIILIGPEGDFTAGEIMKAMENGYNPVSLGDGRMRTETAAIMAAATAAIINKG
jgi:16S rRNA (uracil1498-N3)-methyltransferase